METFLTIWMENFANICNGMFNWVLKYFCKISSKSIYTMNIWATHYDLLNYGKDRSIFVRESTFVSSLFFKFSHGVIILNSIVQCANFDSTISCPGIIYLSIFLHNSHSKAQFAVRHKKGFVNVDNPFWDKLVGLFGVVMFGEGPWTGWVSVVTQEPGCRPASCSCGIIKLLVGLICRKFNYDHRGTTISRQTPHLIAIVNIFQFNGRVEFQLARNIQQSIKCILWWFWEYFVSSIVQVLYSDFRDRSFLLEVTDFLALFSLMISQHWFRCRQATTNGIR